MVERTIEDRQGRINMMMRVEHIIENLIEIEVIEEEETIIVMVITTKLKEVRGMKIGMIMKAVTEEIEMLEVEIEEIMIVMAMVMLMDIRNRLLKK